MPLMTSSTKSENIKKIRDFKGKSLIKLPLDFVVLDLETTGLDFQYDDIIEFAAIRVRNGVAVDSYESLIHITNKLDPYITELTGITNEMLTDAPSLEDVLSKARAFMGDDILVGYNVNFDINFLYDAYEKTGGEYFNNNYIDAWRFSRRLFPEQKHHRLKDMVETLNISRSDEHRALSDCDATLECYFKLRELALEKYGDEKQFAATWRKKSSFYNTFDAIKVSSIKTDNVVFDETHPLYGKVCVFTGKLNSMTRTDAAKAVVDVGGICGDNVTKDTNYLILGNNDYCAMIKDGKSNKQKKAEKYKLDGLEIEIISEAVFLDLISYCGQWWKTV